MLDDVMSLDEFCPELRGLECFAHLLKEFDLDPQDFDRIAKDWSVHYAELPDSLDGHTVVGEMQLNSNLDPFNASMTFMHELTHVLQYATGKNKVQFEGDGPALKTMSELKDYVADPGERQAARNQLRFLVADNCMSKEQAWEAMQYGWGMKEASVPGEVAKVARSFFEDLWKEIENV